MTHLSGGAVSGIVFGGLLAFLGAIALLLWWRRVHSDLYSKNPNNWGGTWGLEAQRQLQQKIDQQQEDRARRLAQHNGHVVLAVNNVEMAASDDEKVHGQLQKSADKSESHRGSP